MKYKVFCHGFLRNKNRILYLKRGKDKIYPCKWDLPGGFCESNETFKNCIAREFKEETNLDISVIDLIDLKCQIYNDEIIIVLLFDVKLNSKRKINLNFEHTDYEYLDCLSGKDVIWYLK